MTEVEVNPSEYAAAVPELAPEPTVVRVNSLEFVTVMVPLKLSAFAFLTITISPLLLPWEGCVIVKVVPDLLQDNPVNTLELDSIQICAFPERYVLYLETVLNTVEEPPPDEMVYVVIPFECEVEDTPAPVIPIPVTPVAIAPVGPKVPKSAPLPEGPVAPCGPVGPVSPVGPVTPDVPEVPVSPVGPVTPDVPDVPEVPAGPVTPDVPEVPAGPVAPVFPCKSIFHVP